MKDVKDQLAVVDLPVKRKAAIQGDSGGISAVGRMYQWFLRTMPTGQ